MLIILAKSEHLHIFDHFENIPKIVCLPAHLGGWAYFWFLIYKDCDHLSRCPLRCLVGSAYVLPRTSKYTRTPNSKTTWKKMRRLTFLFIISAKRKKIFQCGFLQSIKKLLGKWGNKFFFRNCLKFGVKIGQSPN